MARKKLYRQKNDEKINYMKATKKSSNKLKYKNAWVTLKL